MLRQARAAGGNIDPFSFPLLFLVLLSSYASLAFPAAKRRYIRSRRASFLEATAVNNLILSLSLHSTLSPVILCVSFYLWTRH